MEIPRFCFFILADLKSIHSYIAADFGKAGMNVYPEFLLEKDNRLIIWNLPYKACIRRIKMSTPVISTERLILRKMNKDDVEHLMQIFSDPEAMKYYPATKDEKQTMEWIDWTLGNYAKYGVGLWIVENKETGEFLGQCGIVPQGVDGVTEMEIGYLFARRVWGKGYATEAAIACKKYGFDQIKLKKIISLPDVHNIPSAKVAERIGMKIEKTIHKWGKDVFVYSITK
jgi:RimJ/RimL family protein N-acetyltransferase